jgi:hypothetical protein
MRELFIMTRKFSLRLGKLIKFLSVKVVKIIQEEDNKSTQIKYSIYVKGRKKTKKISLVILL